MICAAFVSEMPGLARRGFVEGCNLVVIPCSGGLDRLASLAQDHGQTRRDRCRWAERDQGRDERIAADTDCCFIYP